MGTSAIKSEDEFVKTYDKSIIIPRKIQAGLAQLKAKNGWCENKDFLTLCDISATDLLAYAERFEDFVILVKRSDSGHPKKIWCGTKLLRDKLRAKI